MNSQTKGVLSSYSLPSSKLLIFTMTNIQLRSTLALWATLLLFLSITTPSHQQNGTPQPANPRLEAAYRALQAWKKTITSDPNNYLANWVGCDVCSYNGVFCAPAPDNPDIQTVAGIDLNHANLAGTLPEELGLLTDLALFHLNSNRFMGTIPCSFAQFKLLYELDLSNNLFCGPFPPVLVKLPSLKYLDIRYNHFDGNIPSSVFNLKLDALFLNNNKFNSTLPKNIGNSPVSVLVLANLNLGGCFPEGITKMGGTLQEIILMNLGFKGCLPASVGQLGQATVFDISFNSLTGPLPDSIGKMKSLEQLNVAHNKFNGEVPASICNLPNLQNFTYSYNYFCGEPHKCLTLKAKDDTFNCISGRPSQRSPQECKGAALSYPPSCNIYGCTNQPMTPCPPPPPPHSPPPPPPSPTGYWPPGHY